MSIKSSLKVGVGVLVGSLVSTSAMAVAKPGTDSATGLSNLATIWNDIVGKFSWLIWGVALLWAAYEFMFGDKKKAWRPLAGAGFLYLIGIFLTIAGGL